MTDLESFLVGVTLGSVATGVIGFLGAIYYLTWKEYQKMDKRIGTENKYEIRETARPVGKYEGPLYSQHYSHGHGVHLVF